MILLTKFRNTSFWLKWCILNFFVVALVGVLMRYNILYTLPENVNHKFMQQSHSHFAFYGWVSACIYALVYAFFQQEKLPIKHVQYQSLMLMNQIGAIGMLFSFFYGGYYWLSIVFSTLSFLSGLLFFIFILKDTKSIKNPSFVWLKLGSFFAVFSAIGIFGLSYFTSKRDEFETLYRASTYFYLHFQYNGFFLFSCIGLFIWYLQKNYISISDTLNSKLSKLFFISTLLGYGLSTVWIETPTYLLVFWFFIALIQLYATIIFVKFVSRNLISVKKYPKHLQALYIVFSSVFIIKAFLPFIALIPEVTQLAFFNVNIVMAYLHLILLVGISVFLIWKTVQVMQIQNKTLLNFAVYFFVFGVMFNEFFLAIGAFTVFFNLISISLAFWLLVSSIIILLAILFLFISVRKA